MNVLLGASLVAAQGSFHEWHPAGPNDVRAPCPMLNTLANHKFLPHDGKSISQEIVTHALGSALNISAELSEFLFSQAITTSPEPNATTFSLHDLGRHNILEHDASLSRADYYFGQDPYTFNKTVFAETRSYWHGPIIDLEMAAASRLARVRTSNATNPTYTLSPLGSGFSVGETAAYILILGDRVRGTVRKDLVEYLFENERLPVKMGWKTPKTVVASDDLFGLMDRIVNVTGLASSDARALLSRSDLHVGRAAV
ncbi:Cloroperoxidase [Lentithecium fluviatile CBS 122367]|uniref:Cloroperoxidase n=1 Tax=Lentithecium fluviatile CBS 122367 TaxID=1168545 RepID=A0A6G1JKH0_9PLEO|nr:Cloroperoxidase [Lentithecium fluviatile CBS 122367]